MSESVSECKNGYTLIQIIAMKSTIRRAEIDDARVFSSLISDNGGSSYVKSSFGQFNFSSLVEFSYISLICGDENKASSFCSFNDGSIVGGEPESFEEAMDEVKQLVPEAKVRLNIG